jgi:hypothetical protein
MPGLEPGIQGVLAPEQAALDCRVEPGNDVFLFGQGKHT